MADDKPKCLRRGQHAESALSDKAIIAARLSLRSDTERPGRVVGYAARAAALLAIAGEPRAPDRSGTLRHLPMTEGRIGLPPTDRER